MSKVFSMWLCSVRQRKWELGAVLHAEWSRAGTKTVKVEDTVATERSYVGEDIRWGFYHVARVDAQRHAGRETIVVGVRERWLRVAPASLSA